MLNKIVNWVLWDKVEPLAYKWEEIEDLVWGTSYEDIIDWWDKLSLLQNQWLKLSTAYFCTCYALSMIVDCLEWENNKTFLSWEEFWNIAVEKWKLDPKVWAYFSDILKLAILIDLISSFWHVKKDVESMKSALRISPLYTGSKNIKYSETYKKWYAVRWKWPWHCFTITKWEKGKWFFTPNSYTPEKWFWIKEQDVDILFDGMYNVSIDTEFSKISNIERIIARQKKDRVIVPQKWKHLSDVDTIWVNLLSYHQMQENFHLGEITEKDFRIFQIAYRRAYRLSTYKQIKI